MYINQMAENSPVHLSMKINNETLEFDTTITHIYKEVYKRVVYCIGCTPITKDDKVINFGNRIINATIQNLADNREYNYIICLNSFNKDKTQLLLFSQEDVNPINHRKAYRVACNFKTVIQIGNNKKAIDGYVHDISYSGISMLFLSDDFNNLAVGTKVSASIFDKEEHVYKVIGTIVRYIDDFNIGKTLIGVEFINPSTAINVLVTKLQRLECKLRKGVV